MASKVSSFETQHQAMVHDTQPDYYGKRLATCSSDKTVKIFDLATKQLLAELAGHDGPVWQVAWAHPKFGSVLASCGYDQKVIIWREVAEGSWQILYEYTKHSSSVNSVAWAPHEHGLVLACASSDNSVSILTYQDDGSWSDKAISAHPVGCNSVSWAPYLKAGALVGGEGGSDGMQIVTGGCDNLVKIWAFNKEDGEWSLKATLKGHTDWVRDVAWAPNIGLPSSTIASCSQDCQCIIWVSDEKSGEWTPKPLPKFPKAVWRVSWSITGNILAVCSGDNKVTLWKEVSAGEWRTVSSVNEAGVVENAS